VFGYNNETTEFGLRRNEIDANGIREAQVHRGVISGFNVDIAYAGGRIYSSRGDVVDGEKGMVVGKLAFNGLRPDAPFAVDPLKKRAFYHRDRQIEVFDTDRLVKVGAIEVALESRDATQLILIGGSGLACRSAKHILIISRKQLP
jgi:hypothetical protein